MYMGEYYIFNAFIANLINLDQCQINEPYFSFISLFVDRYSVSGIGNSLSKTTCHSFISCKLHKL
jgi:hypothetical protein